MVAQAPRAFPRIHGRRARARPRVSPEAARTARSRATTPIRLAAARDRRGKLAALLRRVPRHRHRRRDDPRPAVHAAVRTGRGGGGDLERRAGPSSTRTGSTARCSCRSSRMLEQHMEVVRLEARTDFRLEKLAGQQGLVRARRRRRRPRRWIEAWRRLVGSAQRHAAGIVGEGPQAARAARRHGRGAVLLPRLVRAAARRRPTICASRTNSTR